MNQRRLQMEHHTRRAVAYIAGRLIAGQGNAAIYDYNASSHFHFSGTVVSGNVSVYDFDQSCHVGGSPSSLYHYGNSGHIQLRMNGSSFSGYDFATSSHFGGSVNGRAISIYDYGHGRHFRYSI
jgi:hypothetical protein